MTSRSRSISPVDGSVYLTRTTATTEQIEATLAGADAAAARWAATALDERAAVVERMVDVDGRARRRHRRRAGLADGPSGRRGRAGRDPPGLPGTGSGHGGRWRRRRWPTSTPAATRRPVGVIRRRPLGVVLVLAPWNYPYLCSVNTVVPALLAGNAVVLKTASQTPLVAERYAEAFAAAGLPDGVFGVPPPRPRRRPAPSSPTSASATWRSPGRSRSATWCSGPPGGGSSPPGSSSAARTRPTCGPTPTSTHAVANLVDGSFFNSGQSCCGIERIYVHRDVHDAFVEAFVAAHPALRARRPARSGHALWADGAGLGRRRGARARSPRRWPRRRPVAGRPGRLRAATPSAPRTWRRRCSSTSTTRWTVMSRGDVRAGRRHHGGRRRRRGGAP